MRILKQLKWLNFFGKKIKIMIFEILEILQRSINLKFAFFDKIIILL